MMALLSPLALKLAAGALVAALLVGGFFWIDGRGYDRGRTETLNAIAAQDQEAIDAAFQARLRVRACRERGGVWDVTTGQCR